MRRLLALALCATAIVAVALAQPKPADYPMLTANNAKMVGSAEVLSPCTGAAFVEGKQLLVASDDGGRLHVWKREEGKEWLKEKPKSFKAHERGITALAAAGELAASASTDG